MMEMPRQTQEKNSNRTGKAYNMAHQRLHNQFNVNLSHNDFIQVKQNLRPLIEIKSVSNNNNINNVVSVTHQHKHKHKHVNSQSSLNSSKNFGNKLNENKFMMRTQQSDNVLVDGSSKEKITKRAQYRHGNTTCIVMPTNKDSADYIRRDLN